MTRCGILLVATALWLLACEAAFADELVRVVDPPVANDLETRFEAMSAELANLQARMNEMESAEYTPGYAHGCDRPIRGWYGGFELVVVRPHFQNPADFFAGRAVFIGEGGGGKDGGTDAADGGNTDAGGGGDTDAADGGNTDAGGGGDAGSDVVVDSRGGSPTSLQPAYNFQATPRFFLGWRADGGLGVRGRYWILDANSNPLVDSSNTENGLILTQSLNLQAADLEITQLACLGPCELEFSGGVRYGHVNTATTVTPDVKFYAPTRLTTNFDGCGPTVALALRRPLGDGGLAILGNVRGSALFGQNNYHFGAVRANGSVASIAAGKSEFDLAPVFETQVGLEKSWWNSNGRFALRGMFEAMWWGGVASGLAANPDGGQNSLPLFRTDESLGAIGVTAAFVYEH